MKYILGGRGHGLSSDPRPGHYLRGAAAAGRHSSWQIPVKIPKRRRNTDHTVDFATFSEISQRAKMPINSSIEVHRLERLHQRLEDATTLRSRELPNDGEALSGLEVSTRVTTHSSSRLSTPKMRSKFDRIFTSG